MLTGLYINFNGQLLPCEQPIITADNRSFRYGDGVFETIRFAHGKAQLLKRHITRLTESMETLKFDIPKNYTPDYFKQEIEKLAQKNNVEKGARIRLTVYRKEGGYYTSLLDEPLFLIECEPIDEGNYNLNSKGYAIDIFQEYKKPINRLSNIKSNNALIYILAAAHKKANDLDDCIILNQNLQIIESISSNIFAVKNGVLYTPPVVDGCVDGVMRSRIIEVAKANRISVYEVNLQMNVLLHSDEIFLTNAISGVRWVATYRAKHYGNQMAKTLIDKLNENME